MALASAVQGARRTGQSVTWLDEDGEPFDLDGVTITGRKRREATGDAADLDGVFTILDASAGQFQWQYGTADVAVAGRFDVQFIATRDGLNDKTFVAEWEVREAL